METLPQSVYKLQQVRVSDTLEYQQVCDLRQSLTEAGYSQTPQLEIDRSAQIYLLYHNSEPVATLRLVYTEDKSYYIGRLAVARHHQRSSHGLEILKRVMPIILARVKPNEEIYGVSQSTAFAFHAKSGFFPAGPSFMHAGAEVRKMLYDKDFRQKL